MKHFNPLKLLAIFLMSFIAMPANAGVTSFLISDSNIQIFKTLSIASVVLFGYLMVYIKKPLASRKTFGLGVLLTILGLLHVFFEFKNYMVISSGLIALAGTLLVFGNVIAKIFYGLGLLIIAVVSAHLYGAGSSQFITSIGILFVIGYFVLTADCEYETLEHEDKPQTADEIRRDKLLGEKLRERQANSALDVENTSKILKLAVLGLFLLMVLATAISTLF